jgi:hypothetical protein
MTWAAVVHETSLGCESVHDCTLSGGIRFTVDSSLL